MALTLRSSRLRCPMGMAPPLIDSVVAPTSPPVQTSGTVSLTATAHDPSAGDTLTYLSHTHPRPLPHPTAATPPGRPRPRPRIQRPHPHGPRLSGLCPSLSIPINVVSGTSTGSRRLTISFNLGPVVSKVSASRPRRRRTAIAVSANASDADGGCDKLPVERRGLHRRLDQRHVQRSLVVPSAIPPGACHDCKLTVTVQDGRGGQGSGFLNLCIAAATTERFPPPSPTSTSLPSASSPGQTVAFDVTALDTQASAMTFTWTANTGSLATAQNTATTSHVVWTVPPA